MKEKVLIVDDSMVSRMMVKKVVLAIKPDCEITEASSGDEALEIMRNGAADYVLMDFNMPGTDGLTAAIRIREMHPDVPISLVTANVQEALRERTENAGISFIRKPLAEDHLKTFFGV
jgi:CheY-like chemotaxis protein